MVKKVVCALSGGVDSAVALYLAKQSGLNVVRAIFMRNWDSADERGSCSLDADLEDAKYISKKLNVELTELNFVKEYWHNVFENTVAGYRKGVTPNPDILCNKHVKFGALLETVKRRFNVDYLVTGHYARQAIDPDGRARLLMANDSVKDQTFFISQISQSALQRAIFPIGELVKADVKEMARKIGLERIAVKRESMGMCFIGKRSFKKFISEYVHPTPVRFVHLETGEVLATRNDGLHCYTIGERAKIKVRNLSNGDISSRRSKHHRPAFFITEKCLRTNTIYVAPHTFHPALFSFSFFMNQIHWIRNEPQATLTTSTSVESTALTAAYPFACQFRFQHSHPVIPCIIYKRVSPISARTNTIVNKISEHFIFEVRLHEPFRALTPGQFAVFYSGSECLGSGVITEVGPSLYDVIRRVGNKHDIGVV